MLYFIYDGTCVLLGFSGVGRHLIDGGRLPFGFHCCATPAAQSYNLAFMLSGELSTQNDEFIWYKTCKWDKTLIIF